MASPSLDESGPRFAPAGCGLGIFLLSLAVLFLAGMAGFVLLRLRAGGDLPVHPPASLWLSTALLVASSLTMGLAQWESPRRLRPTRLWLLLTAGLALAFLINQVPALASLLEQHFRAVSAVRAQLAGATQPALTAHPALYLAGLIFFLIILHGLHLVGGLVALGLLLLRAFTAPAGPDFAARVRLTGAYWHFLGVVWLVMFAAFQTL